MSVETWSRLLKRQPEIQKRTKVEEASQEPQERKSRKLCQGKRTFRERTNDSKKTNHAKSWG